MNKLTAIDRNLINIAKKARTKAYAPYSKFKVGAALLGKSGKIYTGCNVENASHGATICAERAALVKAVSEGEKKFKKIAVIASMKSPCTPCGICRQVLYEFAPDIEVIMANTKGKMDKATVRELFPKAFYDHK